jgi:hypothetical protein
VAELKKTYCICIGEDQVKTISWEEKKKLNNEKLTRYMANKFISFLQKNKKINHNIKIIFSTKKIYAPGTRKAYWGIAYTSSRPPTLVLYRHSVWIFLHELAHACAPEKIFHGEVFAKYLRKLHSYWKEFKKGCGRNNGKTKK